MAEQAAATSAEWTGWTRPLAPSRVDVLVGLAEARQEDNATAAADLAERAADEARKEGEDAALTRALTVMISCRLGLGVDPLDLLAASQGSSGRQPVRDRACSQMPSPPAELSHRVGLLDSSRRRRHRGVLGLELGNCDGGRDTSHGQRAGRSRRTSGRRGALQRALPCRR